MNELARTIAEKVEEYGGRAYFVGGFVRDKLLGIENKDNLPSAEAIQKRIEQAEEEFRLNHMKS